MRSCHAFSHSAVLTVHSEAFFNIFGKFGRLKIFLKHKISKPLKLSQNHRIIEWLELEGTLNII